MRVFFPNLGERASMMLFPLVESQWGTITLILPAQSSRYEDIVAGDREKFEKHLDIYAKLYDEAHPWLGTVRSWYRNDDRKRATAKPRAGMPLPRADAILPAYA
jgi:hypothetical protein